MKAELNQEPVFVFYSDTLQHKSVDTKSGKKYYVEGYISTGDLDLVNDIVTKGCMDDMTEQFNNRVIKLDFEHEAFRGKSNTESMINKTRIPLGKAVDRNRDENGVKVKWELNTTWKKFDEKGNVVMNFDDVWSNIKNQYYDAFSIAYVPTRTASSSKEGKDIRLLDKLNLLNVALTGNPINPGARATMSAVMAKSLEYMKGHESMHYEAKPYKKSQNLKFYAERLMATANQLKSIVQKNKGDKNMEINIKDDETKVPGEEDQEDQSAEGAKEGGADQNQSGDASESGAAEDAGADAEQKGNAQLLEVKSRLDKMEVDMKAKDKEINELKDVVEKARQKAAGPEDKSKASDNRPEVKSVGPLDYI